MCQNLSWDFFFLPEGSLKAWNQQFWGSYTPRAACLTRRAVLVKMTELYTFAYSLTKSHKWSCQQVLTFGRTVSSSPNHLPSKWTQPKESAMDSRIPHPRVFFPGLQWLQATVRPLEPLGVSKALYQGRSVLTRVLSKCHAVHPATLCTWVNEIYSFHILS